MTELHEMIKIADIHAGRVTMALKALEPLLPFDAHKIQSLDQETLLMTDLLVHRFGKLQDLLGNKIINEYLLFLGEYAVNLSMLDKIHRLEQLEIINDAELWKEMRYVRNHITHEYPDHPEFTAADLNRIISLSPNLLMILDNIKRKISLGTDLVS